MCEIDDVCNVEMAEGCFNRALCELAWWLVEKLVPVASGAQRSLDSADSWISSGDDGGEAQTHIASASELVEGLGVWLAAAAGLAHSARLGAPLSIVQREMVAALALLTRDARFVRVLLPVRFMDVTLVLRQLSALSPQLTLPGSGTMGERVKAAMCSFLASHDMFAGQPSELVTTVVDVSESGEQALLVASELAWKAELV